MAREHEGIILRCDQATTVFHSICDIACIEVAVAEIQFELRGCMTTTESQSNETENGEAHGFAVDRPTSTATPKMADLKPPDLWARGLPHADCENDRAVRGPEVERESCPDADEDSRSDNADRGKSPHTTKPTSLSPTALVRTGYRIWK